MAKPKYIGQNEDHDGNEIRNFVLWLLTSAQALLKTFKVGQVYFDTDKEKVCVKVTDEVRELVYKEQQKEITSAYTILAADDRKLIWITSNTGFEITVNELPDDFYCEFYNAGSGSINFISGTATTNFPEGYILAPDKYCTILKRNSTETVYLIGNLTS